MDIVSKYALNPLTDWIFIVWGGFFSNNITQFLNVSKENNISFKLDHFVGGILFIVKNILKKLSHFYTDPIQLGKNLLVAMIYVVANSV